MKKEEIRENKIIKRFLEWIGLKEKLHIVDYRRLFSKLGTLDGEDFKKIRMGFENLYKYS